MKLTSRVLLSLWIRARRLFGDLPFPYSAPWGVWLLLYPDDTGLSLLKGTYNEVDLIQFVMSILKPGDVFVDIGANQGLYTVAGAKIVSNPGSVLAIEPNPAALVKLRANLRVNRLRNVRIVDCAVGCGPRRQSMFVCEPPKNAFSSLRQPDRKDIAWTNVEVEVFGLDELLERVDVNRVDYIKMDVEGGERDIIASGQITFSRQPRPIAQFEVNDKRTGGWGYQAASLPEWFAKAGYSVYELGKNGFERHQIQDRYPLKNLIAVPDERMSNFARIARMYPLENPA